MSDFAFWFQTGFHHIGDLNAYDHILFLAALCASYTFREIKSLLILITAFTIGHSVSLALAVFNFVKIPGICIEFLIPCTILITCTSNLYQLKKSSVSHMLINYIFAGAFGLIHGLGFSSLLRSMLGKEENVIGPLLGFNLGLEGGQIIITICVFVFAELITRVFKIKRYDFNFFLSSAVFGIAFIMASERLTELFK